ncbi:MAG: LysM peptidoglycan-binding domain-containing protein [bacterium]|nr:LysM peptidoglycan-binding domain-containing protein [bacterium]
MQHGDILEAIALAFGVTAASLREQNQLTNGDVTVGEVLQIPLEATGDTETPAFDPNPRTSTRHSPSMRLMLPSAFQAGAAARDRSCRLLVGARTVRRQQRLPVCARQPSSCRRRERAGFGRRLAARTPTRIVVGSGRFSECSLRSLSTVSGWTDRRHPHAQECVKPAVATSGSKPACLECGERQSMLRIDSHPAVEGSWWRDRKGARERVGVPSGRRVCSGRGGHWPDLVVVRVHEFGVVVRGVGNGSGFR